MEHRSYYHNSESPMRMGPRPTALNPSKGASVRPTLAVGAVISAAATGAMATAYVQAARNTGSWFGAPARNWLLGSVAGAAVTGLMLKQSRVF